MSRWRSENYIAHRSGYTYAEISADMGLAEMTVRRHIGRAHMTTVSTMDLNGNTLTEKCRQADLCAKGDLKPRPPGSKLRDPIALESRTISSC